MKENNYYFPHDFHARHDPKLSAVRKIYGPLGSGVYWDLVEIMHVSGGKIEKFPKLYTGLAHQLNIDEATLKQMVECFIGEFGLFKEDNNFIWSERVLDNLKVIEEKRAQYAAAGRLGGIASSKKRSDAKATLKGRLSEAQAISSNKINKIREDKINNKDLLVVKDIFNHFVTKTKRNFQLTPTNKTIIHTRLKEGYTREQLKTAINNFVQDDWPDRHKHMDLIYCLGKQHNKPDALEKWLNFKPKNSKQEMNPL